MKKYGYAFLLAVATAAIAPVAMADTVNFTYNNGGVSATGVLDVTQITTNEYGITGGTITLTGGAFTGTGTILPDLNGIGNPYSPAPLVTVDNLLYPNSNPELDVFGFSFEADGNYIGKIWSDGSVLGYGLYDDGAGWENVGTWIGGSFCTSDPTVTPEPSTFLLLGTGLLLLAFAFRKARSNQLVAVRAA